MGTTLTIIERIIIETIKSKQEVNLTQLEIQTGLPEFIVENTINDLIEKDLVDYKNGVYMLASQISSTIKNQYNSKENLHAELTDIVQACILNTVEKKNKSFNLKKVALSESEEKIYKGMLYNMQSFLDSIQCKETKTKNKKIIFWGEDTYENICNTIITN